MEFNENRTSIEKLKYVQWDVQPDKLRSFPDFLIVGPQRTGTSWLYKCLRSHPEILMSEPKEPMFFSQLKRRDPGYFVTDSLRWYLSCFEDTPKSYIKKVLTSAYLARRLYRPKKRGEASAGYVGIDEDVIDDILQLNPQAKAIIMVRDPVERAWSHAKKDLAKELGKSIENVDNRAILEFFEYPYQLNCSRYSRNIPKWLSKLDGRVFVGMFDQIEDDPRHLLEGVCSFIGVEYNLAFFGKNIEQVVNPTQKKGVPLRFRAHLSDLYADELRYLDETFGCNFRERSAAISV